jgi:Domain of unknown function (DUF4335)
MNVQRQYSLPSCKLILEGLADTSAGTTARPPVSLITKIECYFSGQEKPLTGGRDFLESLASTVSDYAQEFLSGISHPVNHRDRHTPNKLVELARIDHNLHRLMIQPQATDGAALSMAPQQLNLTTVQLFDLVEAIDQFYADAQTLPDLTLNLHPLPKRYAAAQEPVAKRIAAPALGTVGLAMTALALFFIPAPPVQRPQPTSTGESQETVSPASPNASATASPPSPDGSASPSTSSDTATTSTTPTSEDEQAALLNNAPSLENDAYLPARFGIPGGCY